MTPTSSVYNLPYWNVNVVAELFFHVKAAVYNLPYWNVNEQLQIRLPTAGRFIIYHIGM